MPLIIDKNSTMFTSLGIIPSKPGPYMPGGYGNGNPGGMGGNPPSRDGGGGGGGTVTLFCSFEDSVNGW